jgi:hypothetical protein
MREQIFNLGNMSSVPRRSDASAIVVSADCHRVVNAVAFQAPRQVGRALQVQEDEMSSPRTSSRTGEIRSANSSSPTLAPTAAPRERASSPHARLLRSESKLERDRANAMAVGIAHAVSPALRW